MTAFRIFLALIFTAVFVYTLITITHHGLNLLPIFFGDIAAMNWPGQFNLDFISYLALSGLWLAWRHHFSAGGLALGILGFFSGIILLAPYLLWASFKAKGDMRILLLGAKRAHSP